MLMKKGSPVRAGVERWVGFSIRHPWISAAGWILLTVFALWSARDLKLKTNLAALLPRSFPSVRELDRLHQKVGGLEKIIFLVESPDSAANRRFALDIGAAMERNERIKFVEWSRDLSFFHDNRLLYMDYGDLVTVYRRVSSRAQMDAFSEPLDFSDIEAKYNTSSEPGSKVEGGSGWATEDGTRRIVMAYPRGESSNMSTARGLLRLSKEQVEQLDPASYHPEMEIFYGGEFKNRVDEYDVILGDIKSTALFALAGIILLISIYFRQVFAFVFIGYPLIAGLAWTFGITAFAIGNLNLITGFLVAVLAGLGIDFGIHVFSRYIEERGLGRDMEEATRLAVIHTGEALSTSATTTVAAFYSLMITEFKGFSEFGFIAGTGILMTLAAVLLTFPAFIAIGEKLRLVRHRKHVAEWRRTNSPWPFARPTVMVFAGLLVAAILGTAGLPDVIASRTATERDDGIQFEYNFSKLRANLPASNLVKRKIYGIRSMPTAPAAIVVEDAAMREEVATSVRAMRDSNGEASLITDVKTIMSYLPDQQDRKMRLVRRIQRAITGREEAVLSGQTEITREELDALLAVEPLAETDLPWFVLEKFRGNDGSLGDFVVIGTSAALTNGLEAIAFANEIRTVDATDETFYASGSAIIFADMLIVMRRDSSIAIGVTLLVVLVIIFLDFRSFRATAIVAAPLFGALALMMGIMTLVGIKLNFYNMVVIPSIIGIGIDNGVHLYHRYVEEGASSLRYVMKTTGGAVLMASVTTMIGFSGMELATHDGLNSMGNVALIGMVSVLAMSVVFMPALLQFLERRSGHPANEGSGDETAE